MLEVIISADYLTSLYFLNFDQYAGTIESYWRAGLKDKERYTLSMEFEETIRYTVVNKHTCIK